MRKIATIAAAIEGVRRVMLCPTDEGCYLFCYDIVEDGPCSSDEFYDSVTDAEEECRRRFGTALSAWTDVPDHPDGCQQDWIRPTRLKRDPAGNVIFGEFETAE